MVMRGIKFLPTPFPLDIVRLRILHGCRQHWFGRNKRNQDMVREKWLWASGREVMETLILVCGLAIFTTLKHCI